MLRHSWFFRLTFLGLEKSAFSAHKVRKKLVSFIFIIILLLLLTLLLYDLFNYFLFQSIAGHMLPLEPCRQLYPLKAKRLSSPYRSSIWQTACSSTIRILRRRQSWRKVRRTEVVVLRLIGLLLNRELQKKNHIPTLWEEAPANVQKQWYVCFFFYC